MIYWDEIYQLVLRLVRATWVQPEEQLAKESVKYTPPISLATQQY